MYRQFINWVYSLLWYKHVYFDGQGNTFLYTKPAPTTESAEAVRKAVRAKFWHLRFVNKQSLYSGKRQTVSIIHF